jgi:spore germination cell wall hydrolase CwlJ-like protein
MATLAFAGVTGAAAENPRQVVRITPTFLSDPVVQPIPVPPAVVLVEEEQPPVSASSLSSLISAQSQGELSRELGCLAGAIYFEAKSEPLIGQLAVGRVVIARSKSGRFPNSYCGVVYQPSQFSFVRGGAMPSIARGSQQWRNAVAIAQIAHNGSWRSPAEGALYFHAARVSPGWRLTRVARIENHVFYR